MCVYAWPHACLCLYFVQVCVKNHAVGRFINLAPLWCLTLIYPNLLLLLWLPSMELGPSPLMSDDLSLGSFEVRNSDRLIWKLIRSHLRSDSRTRTRERVGFWLNIWAKIFPLTGLVNFPKLVRPWRRRSIIILFANILWWSHYSPRPMRWHLS